MKKRSKQHCESHWINNQDGAAAIIVTIIMMAIAVLVVSTTALVGVDSLEIGYASQVGDDTILSAESCVEEALVRLSRDSSYSGGTLLVGEANCTISVTGTPCGACTIDVEAVGEAYTRNIQVGATLSGSAVDITSWEEIN